MPESSPTNPQNQKTHLENVAATILGSTKARVVMLLVQWEDDIEQTTVVAPNATGMEVHVAALRSIEAGVNVLYKLAETGEEEKAEEQPKPEETNGRAES